MGGARWRLKNRIPQVAIEGIDVYQLVHMSVKGGADDGTCVRKDQSLAESRQAALHQHSAAEMQTLGLLEGYRLCSSRLKVFLEWPLARPYALSHAKSLYPQKGVTGLHTFSCRQQALLLAWEWLWMALFAT